MNGFAILFTLLTAATLLAVPRNWAPLALLVGAAYITRSQQLEVGPLHFPVMRILIAVGLMRITMKGEKAAGGMNPLDRMIMVWSICDVCTIALHRPEEWVFRLGLLYDTVGSYFLFRVFIQKPEDMRTLFKMVCLLLIPLSATMLVERFKGSNPLYLIGFGPLEVTVTNGHNRASGAFAIPILAGTVGGVCVPMAVYFWREKKALALMGLAATFAIVYASGSSGPVMTTLSGLIALWLWKIRTRLKTVRWLVVFLVMGLSFVMNDPVYFLMARIDITGGSTGYFRAKLIQSTIDHFSEWWLAGTDYTRHWMPSGILANANHTDMTNFFVQMGVWGGLPLMLVFMAVLYVAFKRVGEALKANRQAGARELFLIWTLGAILFAHVVTFLSISYFDQTIIFLTLSLACIGSLRLKNATPIGATGEKQAKRSSERTTAVPRFAS